ncbi:MAG: hypothetical protein KC766_16910 [Myxococcales bacterium]|nr:hypothetical protein [Myxococcales bacterium]
MDHAVALVQAYLYVNGYFTVAEYPVVKALPRSGYATATDIDLLALRLPEAGGIVPARKPRQQGNEPGFRTDPALAADQVNPEMLLAEVKEGKAALNRGATDPAVVRAVLSRFGCCPEEHLSAHVQELLRKGNTQMPSGLRVRQVVFGSLAQGGGRHLKISLGHVLEFLRKHVRDNWSILRHVQVKDPVFGLLVLAEKARRAATSREQTRLRGPNAKGGTA